MNKDTNVIERLNRSEVYGKYQKAFGKATELPLTLRSLETWQLGTVTKRTKTPSAR